MTTNASVEPTAKPEAKKGATTIEQLFNVFVFVVFLALWAAFAYALVANQGGLDQVWNSVRGLPLIAQAVVWLLFLPVTIGLWVWETAWPLIVRLPVVMAIAGWNLWMFFPKGLFQR
jgi:hypothetical protein